MVTEVAPFEQNRYTGDFPVAGRRIFTGRELMRPGVCANDVRTGVHPGSNLTGRALVSFDQPQTGQIRQIEWAFTAMVSLALSTGFSNVAHRV